MPSQYDLAWPPLKPWVLDQSLQVAQRRMPSCMGTSTPGCPAFALFCSVLLLHAAFGHVRFRRRVSDPHSFTPPNLAYQSVRGHAGAKDGPTLPAPPGASHPQSLGDLSTSPLLDCRGPWCEGAT